MTVKEAAERLEISPDTVYALCMSRRMPHERHGSGRGTIRITESQLAEYRLSVTVEMSTGQPYVPTRRPIIPDRLGMIEASRKAAREKVAREKAARRR